MINIKITGVAGGETIEHNIDTSEFILVTRDGPARGNYKTIGLVEDALTLSFAMLDETMRTKNEFLRRNREAQQNTTESDQPQQPVGQNTSTGYLSAVPGLRDELLENKEEILTKIVKDEE